MLKERIKSILQYKKSGIVLTVMLGLACIVISIIIGFNFNNVHAHEEIDLDWLYTEQTKLFNIIQLRENAGLIGYSESYDELHALVYDTPRTHEYILEQVDILSIDSRLSNVIVRSGEQDHIIIRFTEWLYGQHTIVTDDNNASIHLTIPLFIGVRGDNLSGRWNDSFFSDRYFAFTGWLDNFIEERGDELAPLIEIIIPLGMDKIEINTIQGNITIDDGVTLNTLSAKTVLGRLTISDNIDIASLITNQNTTPALPVIPVTPVLPVVPHTNQSINNTIEIYPGLTVDADVYNELLALVFDEPRTREYTFNSLDDLKINTLLSNVKISQGNQEHITLRFTEWIEGQYTIQESRNKVTMETTIPILEGIFENTGNISWSSPFGISINNNSFTTNGWLALFLKERGDDVNTLIEIIVPLNIDTAIIVNIINTIEVNNVTMNSLTINMASGNTIINDSTLSSSSVNIASGHTIINNSILSSSSVNIASGTADIISSKLSSSSVNMASGSTTISESDITQVSFNVTSGTMNLQRLNINDDISISVVSGSVYLQLLEDVSYYSIRARNPYNTGTISLGGRAITEEELYTRGKTPAIDISVVSSGVDITCPNGTVGSGK